MTTAAIIGILSMSALLLALTVGVVKATKELDADDDDEDK